MTYLLAVSIIWAFSFGIIGSTLKGIDSSLVATFRLGIACLCFAPFFKPQKLSVKQVATLAAIGGLQFGVMYLSYIAAFRYLPSHLVALFSIFTPLYIALFHQVCTRMWNWKVIVCAVASVVGAAIIKYQSADKVFWTGFFLMQVSNLAFGIGQILYRNWRARNPDTRDHQLMANLYAGATIVALAGYLIFGDKSQSGVSSQQWLSILYLGAIASGLGFFLWNKGATKASTAGLAASNNAVVPVAMATSLFVFGEINAIDSASILRLATGSILIFAAIVLGKEKRTAR